MRIEPETIRARAKSRGLTSRAIAAGLRVNERQVSHWLKGVRPVPAKHLAALVALLGGRLEPARIEWNGQTV